MQALASLDPATLILPGERVWVYARVFEEDAGLLAPGTPVTVEVPATGRTYESTIFALDATVDAATRTVRVRSLIATPAAELRPDAYVTATFRVRLREAPAIPRDAVLDTGTRRIVFVVSDDHRFTPREVRLGPAADGWHPVEDGLAAGERVVTSANFLIDSESRLKAALSAFGDPPAHVH